VRLLVLGGSGFVGRTVVMHALDRGWSVTVFNRGRTAATDARAEHVRGDRLRASDLAALGSRRWDAAVDTWAGAPRAVRDSASALRGVVDRYLYVSSGSVYDPPAPVGGDETSPTIAADPGAGGGSYPERKRGGELAVEAAFGGRALLARAGTIVGPYEDVGRLTWWLLRLERGGRVLAPGPSDLALQVIDARDLALFLLHAASDGLAGAYNVVSRAGHATMGELLEACSSVTGGGAELVWVDPDALVAAGVEPWTEMPIWLPPGSEFIGMHRADVERAHRDGLRCRPVGETVADTWKWLVSVDRRPRLRSDVPRHGIGAERERRLLAALAG
jgi:2'-hydroxyisoflavone reductase